MDARLLYPLAMVALGFAFALVLLRGMAASFGWRLLEALALAPGAGALLSSLAFFFAAFFSDRAVTKTSWSIALAAVTAAFLLGRRLVCAGESASVSSTVTADSSRPASSRLRVAAFLVFGVSIAIAAVAFHEAQSNRPHGGWDAQAIWNVRARLLARGDGHWAETFKNFEFGHPDYPLLLPGAIATQFLWFGTDDILFPAATAFLFLGGLGLMVFTSAWRFGGPLSAVIAVPLVLGTSHVVQTAQAQLADVPLAYFFLAAWTGLAAARDNSTWRVPDAAVAAALAGLLWTKNEGIEWALVLVVTWLFGELLRRRARSAFSIVWRLIAAGLPALLALALFKMFWPRTNVLVRDVGKTMRDYLADGVRWRTSLSGLWNEVSPICPGDAWTERTGVASWLTANVGWSRWGAVWFLLSLALLIGGRWRAIRRAPSLVYGGIAWLLTVTAIVLVYVVIPHRQIWHIDTSMSRLLLHIYPAAVVGVAAAICRSRLDEAET